MSETCISKLITLAIVRTNKSLRFVISNVVYCTPKKKVSLSVGMNTQKPSLINKE